MIPGALRKRKWFCAPGRKFCASLDERSLLCGTALYSPVTLGSRFPERSRRDGCALGSEDRRDRRARPRPLLRHAPRGSRRGRHRGRAHARRRGHRLRLRGDLQPWEALHRAEPQVPGGDRAGPAARRAGGRAHRGDAARRHGADRARPGRLPPPQSEAGLRTHDRVGADGTALPGCRARPELPRGLGGRLVREPGGAAAVPAADRRRRPGRGRALPRRRVARRDRPRSQRRRGAGRRRRDRGRLGSPAEPAALPQGLGAALLRARARRARRPSLEPLLPVRRRPVRERPARGAEVLRDPPREARARGRPRVRAPARPGALAAPRGPPGGALRDEDARRVVCARRGKRRVLRSGARSRRGGAPPAQRGAADVRRAGRPAPGEPRAAVLADPAPRPGPIPGRGEHTDAVLRELGCSTDDLSRLRAAEVVANPEAAR